MKVRTAIAAAGMFALISGGGALALALPAASGKPASHTQLNLVFSPKTDKGSALVSPDDDGPTQS
jgi:hypothetical protein